MKMDRSFGSKPASKRRPSVAAAEDARECRRSRSPSWRCREEEAVLPARDDVEEVAMRLKSLALPATKM